MMYRVLLYVFVQVYKQFGKELCIVVTNLNQMSIEYFHPKTTPNVPVRLAVRMSMSIPGRWSCTRADSPTYQASGSHIRHRRPILLLVTRSVI